MKILRVPDTGRGQNLVRALAVLVCISFVLIPALAVAGCKTSPTVTEPDRILMFDNVTLEAGNLQDFYDTDELPPGSFNADGYYLSPRFYLFAGDTIKVVVTCDAPVKLSDDFSTSGTSILTGLNSITEENEPSSNIGLVYFDETQDTSSGAMWQITYLFPSQTLPSGYYVPSGYYQLNIFNASGGEAHAEFSITLIQP